MGGGGSKKMKKMNVNQQGTQKPSVPEENRQVSRSPQSPPLVISGQSRSGSANSLAISRRSIELPVLNQGSPEQNIKNSPNGIENHRSPSVRGSHNNNPQENIDDSLPHIDNPLNKQKSPSPTSITYEVARLSSGRPPTGSDSLSESHKNFHRNHSTTFRGQVGRCSHCPHCRRVSNGNLLSPLPKWVMKNPGPGQFNIDMDQYDIEAVKKKAIFEDGHLRGSYDYRPQLTMEKIDDYDPRKITYYTQPFLAKTSPHVTPTRTPFPEYQVLQHHERRINKPYTLPLFVD